MATEYMENLTRLLVLEARLGELDNIQSIPKIAGKIRSAGGSLDACGEDGLSALVWACREGHDVAAKTLLDAGASVSHPCEGSAPLLWAAEDISTSTMEVLIQAGADPNWQNRVGRTALMTVARSQIKDAYRCVDYLLSVGAQLEARDEEGLDALNYACRRGASDCCRALIAAGADIESRDKNGSTPAMASAMCGAYLSKQHCLAMLIDAGCDLDAKNNQGETALMWAACNGKMDSARLLVDAGCDLYAVDSAGLDAVAWAKSEKHWEVAGFIESAIESRAMERQVESRGVSKEKRRI